MSTRLSGLNETDRLRERVAELEDALGLTAEIPAELVPRSICEGTSFGRPKVLEVIGVLLTRPFAHSAALFDALYGTRPECDQPQPQILSVYVCRVRASLRRHGIELKTRRGAGWYLTEDDKTKLRAVIAQLNDQRVAA
jgi:hypothetical protein